VSDVLHTPECDRVLAEWLSHPAASVEHRLAEFARLHTDPEVRDLLIDVFDEDHGTPAEPFALALWPLLTRSTDDDLAESPDVFDEPFVRPGSESDADHSRDLDRAIDDEVM